MPFAELAAEVVTEVRMLRAIQHELALHAAAREQHYRQVDPGQLARSLPGFAEISAPALVAIMGRPGRFRDATRFKSYAGLAPRASETGETDRKGIPMSKAGPSLLRSTLFQAADTARRQDPQLARIYYQQMTERGATPPQGLLRCRRAPRRTRMDRAQPRHPVRDLRQQRQPGHPGRGQAHHRRPLDRAGGGPQTAAQPQDGGEGPSGGHDRAGQARRPSPPPILTTPHQGRQPHALTSPPAQPAGQHRPRARWHARKQAR